MVAILIPPGPPALTPYIQQMAESIYRCAKPFLFTVYTYDCVSHFQMETQKFADNTPLVGRIRDGDGAGKCSELVQRE